MKSLTYQQKDRSFIALLVCIITAILVREIYFDDNPAYYFVYGLGRFGMYVCLLCALFLVFRPTLTRTVFLVCALLASFTFWEQIESALLEGYKAFTGYDGRFAENPQIVTAWLFYSGALLLWLVTWRRRTFDRLVASIWMGALVVAITIFHLLVIKFGLMGDMENRKAELNKAFVVHAERAQAEGSDIFDIEDLCALRNLLCFTHESEESDALPVQFAPIVSDTKGQPEVFYQWWFEQKRGVGFGIVNHALFYRLGDKFLVMSDDAVSEGVHIRHFIVLYGLVAALTFSWMWMFVFVVGWHRLLFRRKKTEH